MRSTGVMEIARRLVPLVLLLAAIAHIASAPDGTRPWLAWGFIAGAVAVYLLLPFEQPPEGALRHSRLAAVLLPDLIGFMLCLTFFGIYIVLVADNPNLWGAILLLGPPGAIGLAILLVAAWYASFWMVIEADRLSVATLRARQELPFAAIRSVKPTRHLPPAGSHRSWCLPAGGGASAWRCCMATGPRTGSASILPMAAISTRRSTPSRRSAAFCRPSRRPACELMWSLTGTWALHASRSGRRGDAEVEIARCTVDSLRCQKRRECLRQGRRS